MGGVVMDLWNGFVLTLPDSSSCLVCPCASYKQGAGAVCVLSIMTSWFEALKGHIALIEFLTSSIFRIFFCFYSATLFSKPYVYTDFTYLQL